MTDTIYFLLAVAATSAVIFALPTRADRRRRRGPSDGGSSDPGISSTSDGWTTNWFGSNHFGPTTDLYSSSDSGWSGGDSGGGAGGGSND